jgi:chromatin segregation and condensation protein Rec8/ScpA/Scc1 (kleisin family)
MESVRFEDLFEPGYAKVTLIVTFLALLEIIRLGLAKIYQDKAFGVIWILNPRKDSDESAEDVQEDAAAEPSEVLP